MDIETEAKAKGDVRLNFFLFFLPLLMLGLSYLCEGIFQIKAVVAAGWIIGAVAALSVIVRSIYDTSVSQKVKGASCCFVFGELSVIFLICLNPD
jgi:hypothetical protein